MAAPRALDNEDTQTLTAPVRPIRRLGIRQLTRAHLRIAQRPEIAVEGHAVVSAIRVALEEVLGRTIKLDAQLRGASVSPVGSLSRSTVFALLETAEPAGKCVLEVEPLLATALLDGLSGKDEPRMLPTSRLTRIEEAGFGYLLLVALSALRKTEGRLGRIGARLLGLYGNRDAVLDRIDVQQSYLSFDVDVAIGTARGMARVLVPALNLQAVAQEYPLTTSFELNANLAEARLSGRLRLGGAPLDGEELRKLALRDVVMFEGTSFEAGTIGGRARILFPTFELHGQLGAEGLTLNRVLTGALPEETTMTDEPSLPTQLPVDVEIELTRVRVALGDIAALKPGSLLPLHINAVQPVVLRVGDRAIARAELVDIDGEVGARIISLVA